MSKISNYQKCPKNAKNAKKCLSEFFRAGFGYSKVNPNARQFSFLHSRNCFPGFFLPKLLISRSGLKS
jgi:hypothetical protein